MGEKEKRKKGEGGDLLPYGT
jgi:hypothetical protein